MLLQNLLKFGLSLVLLVSLSACSSAVFPEVIEDDSLSETILTEDDALASDTDNAAYEGEEDEVFADVVSDEKHQVIIKEDEKELIAPVKTTEVKVAELSQNVETSKPVEQKTEEKQEFVPSVTYRLATIYFDNGSASVSAAYNAKIREAAGLVKNNNAQIRVLGFSSSRTRNMDAAAHKLANFKISAERAENVAAALRRAGVPADNITVEALSDSVPAYLEVMPEGERLNRRAEIYVSY